MLEIHIAEKKWFCWITAAYVVGDGIVVVVGVVFVIVDVSPRNRDVARSKICGED